MKSDENVIDCSVCANGFESSLDRSECLICNPGKYKGESQSTCENCPAGFFSDQSGSSECTVCGSDTFSFEGMPECTPHCLPGQFGETVDNSIQCRDCPLGSTSPGNSSICHPCVAGKFYEKFPETERGRCLDCAGGTYSTSEGLHTCETCDQGTWSPAGSDAKEKCIVCVAGRFKSHMNGCQDCFHNFFTTQSDSFSCEMCAAGKFTSSAGSTSCENCPKGWSSTNLASGCRKCEAGKFNNQEGGLCTACPSGYAQQQIGQESCVSCESSADADLVALGTGRSECHYCPIGTIKSSASECVLCPNGKYGSIDESTGKTSCSLCPVGKETKTLSWWPSSTPVDISFCLDCPAGKYADSEGTPACKNCMGGKYQDLVGQTSCKWCDVSEYSPAGSDHLSDCQSCSYGKFLPRDPSHPRTECCERNQIHNHNGQCSGCFSITYGYQANGEYGMNENTIVTKNPRHWDNMRLETNMGEVPGGEFGHGDCYTCQGDQELQNTGGESIIDYKPTRIIKLSHDKTLVAVGHADGAVEVYLSSRHNSRKLRLTDHSNEIRSLAWAERPDPNGAEWWLYTASNHKMIKYRITKEISHSSTQPDYYRELDFSRVTIEFNETIKAFGPSIEPSYVATLGDGFSIKLYDVNSGQYLRTLGGYTGTFTVDDVSGEWVQRLSGHTDFITTLRFFENGNKIISGSYDKTVKLWNVSSGDEIMSTNVGGYVTAVAAFNSRLYIGTSKKGQYIIVMDYTGNNRYTTQASPASVPPSDFAFDGQNIVAGFMNGQLWSLFSSGVLNDNLGDVYGTDKHTPLKLDMGSISGNTMIFISPMDYPAFSRELDDKMETIGHHWTDNGQWKTVYTNWWECGNCVAGKFVKPDNFWTDIIGGVSIPTLRSDLISGENYRCQGCPIGQEILNDDLRIGRTPNSIPCKNCSSGAYRAGDMVSCQFCSMQYISTLFTSLESVSWAKSDGVLNEEKTGCEKCGPGKFHDYHYGHPYYRPADDSLYDESVTYDESCNGLGYNPTCIHVKPIIWDETCSDCPVGRYRTDTTGTGLECYKCQSGKSSVPGSASCSDCPAGKYTEQGGNICLTCPEGKYNFLEGQWKQINAGVLMYDPCIPLPPGTYSPTGAEILTCPAGTFTLPRSCEACPAGKYSDSEGSIECKLCEPGKYQSTTNSTDCTESCPIGQVGKDANNNDVSEGATHCGFSDSCHRTDYKCTLTDVTCCTPCEGNGMISLDRETCIHVSESHGDIQKIIEQYYQQDILDHIDQISCEQSTTQEPDSGEGQRRLHESGFSLQSILNWFKN